VIACLTVNSKEKRDERGWLIRFDVNYSVDGAGETKIFLGINYRLNEDYTFVDDDRDDDKLN
jgi:hypothetical protein